MVIDEKRVEAAVLYLRDCAEAYGKSRGHLAYCDANLRRVKSLAMIGMEGSVGDREARAYASEDYHTAMQDLENATADYETMRAKREAAVMMLELWRTREASKRQGLNL